MPRVKKVKATALGELPAESSRNSSPGKSVIFSKMPNKPFRIDRITLEEFVLITIYCSTVLLIFIGFAVVNSLVTIVVKEVRNNRNLSVACAGTPYASGSKITYTVEKNKYKVGDRAKLSIINNSDKSIYLVPCQYFSKFEKKSGNTWQAISLDECSNAGQQVSSVFEKIPRKVEEEIPTAVLGQGVWRGVSDVFFSCQKAKIESCQGKQTLYSNEFSIEPKADVSKAGSPSNANF